MFALQALTLPLDTAKVRLQLQAKSSGPPLYKCEALLMIHSLLHIVHANAGECLCVEFPQSYIAANAGVCLALWAQSQSRRAQRRYGKA